MIPPPPSPHLQVPSILSFNTVYLGCYELPAQFVPGLDAIQYASNLLFDASTFAIGANPTSLSTPCSLA